MFRKITFITLLLALVYGSCVLGRVALALPIRISRNFMASVANNSKKDAEGKKKTNKEKPPELKGKYLVGPPISISALSAPRRSFSLSLCSGASNGTDCDRLDQPFNTTSFFHVKAAEKSGREVRVSLKVLAGKAEIYPYDSTRAAVRVLPKKPGGKLLLEATAQGYDPVRVTLYVAGDAGTEVSSCARLLPPVFETPVIGSSMIVQLVGAPAPYSLEAPTDDMILIYSEYPPQDDSVRIRKKILDAIQHQINQLSRFAPDDLGLKPPSKFSVELTVPHADALGDLRARLASLNNSTFTAIRVGADKILIKSDSQPDCDAWNGYLANVQRIVWGISPESPTARLFYLDAPEAAKALPNGGGAQPSAPAGGGSPTAGSTPDAPPPAKSTSSVSPLAAPKDVVVFNSSIPGDDADTIEKKRILALLDLPRPEMIVNAWVMQNSSKDPKLVSGFSDMVARTVSSFNNALEESVFRGWSYLSGKIKTPGDKFFDPGFYGYVARKYIGTLPYRPGFPGSASQGAQEVLDLRSTARLSPEDLTTHSACTDSEYCLGYGDLFKSLKPRLTDMLLTVIAANNPPGEAQEAIREMELTAPGKQTCSGSDRSDYCVKLRSRLPLPGRSSGTDCSTLDLAGIYSSASQNSSPVMHLECFKSKAAVILGGPQLGLLRAAIADFLFNYKMSQQYPHEFSPYDLSQSADKLNAALSPFIQGFNQDLKAFQEFLQEDLRYRTENLPGASSGWVFGGNKQSFVNNGIVSVRTISGKHTTVDTTSQSFLDASSAPQFADLAKSITDQTITKGANGDPTGVLGNLSANQAQVIMGALQAFRPTTVQIGRALKLEIDPRSLSAASAAEIDVTLNADESAPPTYFGGPKGAQEPNTSRVAKHDTTTRVRVDSIKLFEVSSFSAELQRSRSRFPLLPPFFEIPYVGTLIGIPLPPAKQYHTSSAVLSAIVVPTAADLAYGLNFISDRLLDPSSNCGASGSTAEARRSICVRKALSLRDFHQPIRTFNREKVACFAALGSDCYRIRFDDVPRDPSER